MKKYNKVNEDKSLNDFLSAMGINGSDNSENSGIESPMDFAYAMGVSRYTGKKPERKVQPVSAPIPAKLKYV
ncbi:MAG: hypothetical protein II099_00090 [Firmicutes bacterium]|nr:hypothetical protein [Bacillota bacterium]